MKKLYKFPPHGIWIWYWVCTMVTKKISKFPPPPKLKLTLSVYNRVFAFSTLTWHASVNLSLWRLEVGLILSVVFYMIWASPAWTFSESQQGVSWSDFWVSKSLFRVSQSGVRVSQSPLQSFTKRFPSFTMQVSQYDLQVSEYNLQVSQSKFQNPFSTFRNPIAKFHNPTLTCSPRVSSRFPLNFLMVPCIFLPVPVSACSKFLQGSFRFLSMFLARLFHGVLMRFSYNFFAGFFWFSCAVSFKFLAGFLTVSFWHAFFDSFPRSRPATAEPQTLFSRP